MCPERNVARNISTFSLLLAAIKMGQSPSSPEEEHKRKIEKAKKERAKFVYDRKKIGWDEFGNLRYGIEPKKISSQLKAFVNAENTAGEDEEGAVTTWHVVSSAWVASWLAHVRLAKGKSPAPGPCRNDVLIEWDSEQSKYVARYQLQMSNTSGIGDYRRVTKDTWDAIVRFYPGSGPEITMDFAPPKGGVKDGYVDTASWQVLQHDPPPEQDGGGSRKKKSQARKRFEAFRLNLMASKQRAAEEKAAEVAEEKAGEEKESERQRAVGFAVAPVNNGEPDSDDDDFEQEEGAEGGEGQGQGEYSAVQQQQQQQEELDKARDKEVEDLLLGD